MDFKKLRYDLAMQAATVRLIKYGYDKNAQNDCVDLLNYFSACYEDACKISDQDFKELFPE